MLFKIHYGLAGGFGGANESEIVEVESEEEAEEHAYELACECYEQYDGSNGLMTVEEIMEEYGCDEAEGQCIWEQERDSWLDYRVQKFLNETSRDRWKALLDAELIKPGQTYI